jgi:Tannase and feruloyl esterase/3HB-oligomer hydrolase (3HBOH)
MRGGLGVVAAVVAAGAIAPGAHAASCAEAGTVAVPGAERTEQACLGDLTTAGTAPSGHTDPSDWAGLTPTAQRNPSGVPGMQLDGYFPDTSTTNTTHGWNHDAQFVIRLPDDWNGKLVVTGAPGVRKQYAPDPVIGDRVVSEGYAYASTDKGNSGNAFYEDGEAPGDAIAEWHRRVTELAIAAKQAVAARYGRGPDRTYVTGISNGGYLTRWQLEHRPDLYDGGVDWEGTLLTPDGPNLFTYLPVALREFPRYRRTGDQAAHDAMIAAGFAPGSEFLWDDHYAVYWDLTQRSYREELDPDYDGALTGGIPFCPSGTPSCDADYDYASRGQGVRDAIAKGALTGAIGKPLLTLHGTLDALLPIATDSDVYAQMVTGTGTGALHRYYVIEHGNHVDGRYDLFPDRIRPIQPCWATAFDALDRWVTGGVAPPPSQFVADARTGGVDVANACELPRAGTAGAGPIVPPAQQVRTRARPRGIRARVVRLGGRRYAVRGRVLLPKGLTAARACGSGTVRVRLGAVRRRSALRAGCAFAVRVRLGGRAARGARRTLVVRFAGNRALKPYRAKARRVRLR